MTQYMLSVHHDDGPQYSAEEMQGYFDAVDRFNEKLRAEGNWVFAAGLKPIETSTMVDGRSDEVIVTDGPFSETKEYLGGFWIVEAPDLDVALKLAAEGSKACGQAVEVRPVEDNPGG